MPVGLLGWLEIDLVNDICRMLAQAEGADLKAQPSSNVGGSYAGRVP